MEYRQLASSDLKVSPVCLGTWQFNDGVMDGSKTWQGQSFDTSKSILDTAIEQGINFVDTAEAYLNSESVLGRLLESRRDKVVLASKFGYGSIKKTDYTAEDVERSLNDSLRRLKTDYLDLYQIHWAPVMGDNAAEIVTELKRQQSLGRLKYYGVSNFGVENMKTFLAAGGEPVTNQICYNLLMRSCEYEIVPFCASNNISLLPYSPLQQGLLSGKFLKVEDVPEGRRRTRHFRGDSTSLSRHGQPGCESQLFAAINNIKTLCDERSLSMSSVSLSWLLKQTSVASVITGASSSSQVVENCKFTSITDDLDLKLKEFTEPVKLALGTNCDLWGAECRVN